MFKKKSLQKNKDLRLISIEIQQPILNENVWECDLIMYGYAEINQTLYGQNWMQALTFAIQHAKFNLTLMINDGYCYFDKEENTLLNKTQTLELLDVTYGVESMLDEAPKKAIYLQYIRRLQKADGTEEEQNVDINFLRKEFLDTKIIDYIFKTKPELSAEEIYSKAIVYRPIIILLFQNKNLRNLL